MNSPVANAWSREFLQESRLLNSSTQSYTLLMGEELASANPRPRNGFGLYIWISILLPVLYFFSIGPVAAYYRCKLKPPPPAVVNFYSPLQALTTFVPPFQSFIEWYVDLWLGNTPPTATPVPASPPTSGNSNS
jgi:hypothetical protein